MLEKIFDAQLRQYVKEEMDSGMKIVKYEHDEKRESVWLDGMGDIQTNLYFEYPCKIGTDYIDKKSNSIIDFSVWTEKMEEQVLNRLRRGYKFISIDNIEKPENITMYNIEYAEFVDLNYSIIRGRFDISTYKMEKVKTFFPHIEKVEENVHQYRKRWEEKYK